MSAMSSSKSSSRRASNSSSSASSTVTSRRNGRPRSSLDERLDLVDDRVELLLVAGAVGGGGLGLALGGGRGARALGGRGGRGPGRRWSGHARRRRRAVTTKRPDERGNDDDRTPPPSATAAAARPAGRRRVDPGRHGPHAARRDRGQRRTERRLGGVDGIIRRLVHGPPMEPRSPVNRTVGGARASVVDDVERCRWRLRRLDQRIPALAILVLEREQRRILRKPSLMRSGRREAASSAWAKRPRAAGAHPVARQRVVHAGVRAGLGLDLPMTSCASRAILHRTSAGGWLLVDPSLCLIPPPSARMRPLCRDEASPQRAQQRQTTLPGPVNGNINRTEPSTERSEPGRRRLLRRLPAGRRQLGGRRRRRLRQGRRPPRSRRWPATRCARTPSPGCARATCSPASTTRSCASARPASSPSRWPASS